MSSQYFLIVRSFSPDGVYNILLNIHSAHTSGTFIENLRSPYFKIIRYSNEKQGDETKLLLHVIFEPKNLPKYTHEIMLRKKNGKLLLLVFLAISDPLRITGPVKISFPRCLVNDNVQKLVAIHATSQPPLKYKVTVFG